MGGEEIKKARIRAMLTQREMSDKMGIPLRTIGNWESGVNACPSWTETLIINKLTEMADGLPEMESEAKQRGK